MAKTFKPGEIWRHPSMGLLVVTGEPGCKPGYVKCYWMLSSGANWPWTCLNKRRTRHFTFHSCFDLNAKSERK